MEGFELPTAWFVDTTRFVTNRFYYQSEADARCKMQDYAQLCRTVFGKSPAVQGMQ